MIRLVLVNRFASILLDPSTVAVMLDTISQTITALVGHSHFHTWSLEGIYFYQIPHAKLSVEFLIFIRL